MASIVWADVITFASELSSVPSDAQTSILAWVNTALNISVFGGEDSPFLRLARIYLAAHLGSIRGSLGTVGPVVSESAGGVSRSYADQSSDSALGTTAYGRTFLSLVRVSPARLPVVI